MNIDFVFKHNRFQAPVNSKQRLLVFPRNNCIFQQAVVAPEFVLNFEFTGGLKSIVIENVNLHEY